MRLIHSKCAVFLSLLFTLVITGNVYAATLDVCKSGCAYTTIQAAINAAAAGDTVLVDDGVYTENINLLGRAITVASVNGSANTTINGNALGSVVTFNSGENITTKLEGFTILNGLAENGGGINCMAASSPSITDCVVTGNQATNSGGGINCVGSSSPAINNCQIINNLAYDGGGLHCGNSSAPSITHCTINNNEAGFHGGGLGAHNSSPAIIKSIISNNISEVGGGIACNGSSLELTNCIISYNSAQAGGGAITCNTSFPTIINCTISSNHAGVGGGINGINSSLPVVKNTILWGNTAIVVGDEINLVSGSSIDITYSDIGGGWAGVGNIDSDPLFTGAGDFHLTGGSPCIDTALATYAPADDIDDELRPQGAGYDIGADEYYAAAMPDTITVKQLYTEDAAGIWNINFAAGDEITVNTAITITGDPAVFYDMQLRCFIIDAAGNNYLLGARLYRNYTPGTYYVYLTANLPLAAASGVTVIRSAALLAQGTSLLDRSTLAAYIDIQ